MSEKPQARVECACLKYRVDDLNLDLRQGDVVWVKEDAVRTSPGLAVAMRAGAVTVSWRVRCEVARPATPPWLNRNTKGRRITPTSIPVAVPTLQPLVPTPPVRDDVVPPISSPPTLTHEAVQRMVEETVRAEVRAALAEMVLPPQVNVEDLSRALVTAMGSRLGEPVSLGAHVRPPAIDDGPLYIPTGLVPTGATPALSITEGASDGADLADAQAAMRGLTRRNKKIKPTDPE